MHGAFIGRLMALRYICIGTVITHVSFIEHNLLDCAIVFYHFDSVKSCCQ